MLQIAWFGLLGLWIYWFVANYITFTRISERYYPQIDFNPQNIVALVGGIVLLAGVSGVITILFGKLRRQQNMTNMYDSFIANVTHELKSPLASIRVHLETIRTRDLAREDRDRFLGLMVRDTDRLERHITSILQIAGLEERRSMMNLEVRRADRFFVSLFEQAASQFGLDPERITIIGDAPCMIRADVRSMEIVVDNLIDNAIKYTDGAPEITMRLSCGRRYASMTLSDHGIGIVHRDLKQVFRKFVRLERAENPSVQGTGLGLYWVHEIIRHHKGRVSASSSGPGRGASFTIELPIERPRGRHEAAKRPTAARDSTTTEPAV